MSGKGLLMSGGHLWRRVLQEDVRLQLHVPRTPPPRALTDFAECLSVKHPTSKTQGYYGYATATCVRSVGQEHRESPEGLTRLFDVVDIELISPANQTDLKVRRPSSDTAPCPVCVSMDAAGTFRTQVELSGVTVES